MVFQKIVHTSLYQNVISQLEEYIRDKNLKPMDKIPTERDISEQLGISRSTLREAFRVLEANGVINVTHGGGRHLKRDLSHSNLVLDVLNDLECVDELNLMEMRRILEQGIVELVIERASDKELNSIEKSIVSENNLYESDNIFHLALAKATHNPAFYNVMNMNLALLAKIRKRSLSMFERGEKMLLEHKELLEAIKQRDLSLAKKKMADHLDAVVISILRAEERIYVLDKSQEQ